MKTRRAMLCAVVLAATAMAQPVPVDTQNSRMLVKVFKSGLFSAFAHDHEISAPLASGSIDEAAKTVELRFDARKMQVLDPKVDAETRAKIQRDMHSEKVLDSERFPEIVFTSRSVQAAGADRYRVTGDLALHGTSRPVTLEVTERDGRYVGTTKLKQTAFGIKPISVGGGTVKVKDEIELVFEIVRGK